MFNQEQFACVVKTMAGFEDILVQELKELGISDVKKGVRSAQFRGSLEDIYTVNYWSRLALRVLVDFHEYKAFDDKRLHSKAMQFPWDKLINIDQTFAINSAVSSSYHRHSHFASLRIKDAIADYFMKKYDRRPSVDLDDPDVRIHLHIEKQFVTLSVDSSGDSLHKRGYRSRHFDAPLNEVLAAGMIKLSGWQGESPFWDPMCGSGTLAVEAAMIAKNIAPQIVRDQFGFMNWPNFDPQLFEKVQNKFPMVEMNCKITASDIDSKALNVARTHADNVRLGNDIHFANQDFLKSQAPAKPGVMIINPPYGVRLAHDDVAAFYSNMSDHIKHSLAGWKVWIFTSNTDALKQFGLRPSKKLKLFNGSLECAFYQYEIFAGRRKDQFD